MHGSEVVLEEYSCNSRINIVLWLQPAMGQATAGIAMEYAAYLLGTITLLCSLKDTFDYFLCSAC